MRFFRVACVVAHYRDEQIGNTGPTHLTEHCELVVIGAIEKQNAATEY